MKNEKRVAPKKAASPKKASTKLLDALKNEKISNDFMEKMQFCSYVLDDFLDRKLITPTQNKECQKVLKGKMNYVELKYLTKKTK
jgi:hypothetical protein